MYVDIAVNTPSAAKGEEPTCSFVALPPLGRPSLIQLVINTDEQSNAAMNLTIVFVFIICNIL
jgi:hypothetical protein